MTRDEALVKVGELFDEAEKLCREHNIPMAATLAKSGTRYAAWWHDTMMAGQGIAVVIGAARALVNQGRDADRVGG